MAAIREGKSERLQAGLAGRPGERLLSVRPPREPAAERGVPAEPRAMGGPHPPTLQGAGDTHLLQAELFRSRALLESPRSQRQCLMPCLCLLT